MSQLRPQHTAALQRTTTGKSHATVPSHSYLAKARRRILSIQAAADRKLPLQHPSAWRTHRPMHVNRCRSCLSRIHADGDLARHPHPCSVLATVTVCTAGRQPPHKAVPGSGHLACAMPSRSMCTPITPQHPFPAALSSRQSSHYIAAPR